MDKVVIAGMGVEGGGVTVYGRRAGGVWSFWQEGSSMDLDENDDEVWREWSSDPVPDLAGGAARRVVADVPDRGASRVLRPAPPRV